LKNLENRLQSNEVTLRFHIVSTCLVAIAPPLLQELHCSCHWSHCD